MNEIPKIIEESSAKMAEKLSEAHREHAKEVLFASWNNGGIPITIKKNNGFEYQAQWASRTQPDGTKIQLGSILVIIESSRITTQAVI